MCVEALLAMNKIMPPKTEVSATGKNASQPKNNASIGGNVISANP
jgi:hypothetical protein